MPSRLLFPVFLLILGLEASGGNGRADLPLLLDLGPADGPVEPGFSKVTPTDRYDASRGYGFLTKGHEAFRVKAPARDPNSWRLGPDVHFRNHATPLRVDGIRSRSEMKFRVDVPPGASRITVTLGHLLRCSGSVSLFVNDRLIEKDIAFQHGVYRQICGSNKPNRGSSGVYGFYRRIRFTVRTEGEPVVMRMVGDDTDYRRRLAEEEKKGKPISWAAGRALRGAVPPFENIGEPFVDIPLLGVEVRTAVPAPVVMKRHGRLEYSGSSDGVRRAVAAFNEGRFGEAAAALDGVTDDPPAAALACLYLAGWPPFEEEITLLPKARAWLEASGDSLAALEAREDLALFERALSFHLGRGEPGKNHFVENVQACHLFRSIPEGSPLYWKAQLHAARTALQLDPHRWATSGRTALRWMERIRERFPENRFAVYYLTDTYDERNGPWALPDYEEAHRGAPAWAARLREAYDLTLNLSEWWIENKQKADGSIGGGWGDDVELVGLFGYYAFISEGASPVALKGASKLVNGVYLHSGDIEPESGYIWNLADSEHSAEWTGDTLPMMMLLEYGSPLWIERGMASAKLMRDLWTGINGRGHRHFRSNFTGGLGVGGGGRANDSGINRRCIFPAEQVHWYNRHPAIEKLVLEWASAWAEDAMRTDKGKPKGFIPGDIAYADCEIGGKGAPEWFKARKGRGTVNYDFGGYHAYQLGLLRAAYALTGEVKYIEPIRLEAEAYERMASVREDINAPAGSPEKIKSVLRLGHAVWAEMQGERAAAPKLGYGEVAERCAQIVGAIRKRWPVMTTEASATDRVGFPGVVDIYRYYSGGTSRGLATLPVAATYRGIGRDFASFIERSTEKQLALRLYAFRDGEVRMSVVPWGLEMGGTYRVRVAPDADENGEADGEGVVKEFTLTHRGQPCALRLAGRVPHLVTFDQVRRGRGQTATADLSVWEGDIEYSDRRGFLMVRVHNTGTAAAREVPVILYEGSPESGKVVGRGLINRLEWPKDLVPMTVRLGWRYRPSGREATFTVVVDPENAVEEITDRNNRAARTLRFDPRKQLDAVTPP